MLFRENLSNTSKFISTLFLSTLLVIVRQHFVHKVLAIFLRIKSEIQHHAFTETWTKKNLPHLFWKLVSTSVKSLNQSTNLQQSPNWFKLFTCAETSYLNTCKFTVHHRKNMKAVSIQMIPSKAWSKHSFNGSSLCNLIFINKAEPIELFFINLWKSLYIEVNLV